jgi:hypothetical protein
VQAKTFVKVYTLMHISVASITSTFVTVNQTKGRSIIARRYNSLVFYNNCTIASFHAVRPRRSKFSQSLEVRIECRPYKLLIIKLEISQSFMELHDA